MNQITNTELDPAAWLEQAIGVLALRLRHEVSLTRALRGPDRQEGFLGLFLSDEDAEILLDELAGRLAAEIPNTAHTAAKATMMPTTTSSSIRVNPFWSSNFRPRAFFNTLRICLFLL